MRKVQGRGQGSGPTLFGFAMAKPTRFVPRSDWQLPSARTLSKRVKPRGETQGSPVQGRHASSRGQARRAAAASQQSTTLALRSSPRWCAQRRGTCVTALRACQCLETGVPTRSAESA